MDKIGLYWIGLDWIRLDQIGLAKIGLDWIRLDWIGLDKIRLGITTLLDIIMRNTCIKVKCDETT